MVDEIKVNLWIKFGSDDCSQQKFVILGNFSFALNHSSFEFLEFKKIENLIFPHREVVLC